MLKQRILTALILIPLVIAGILYLPVIGIALIFGLLMLMGAWEWSRLSGVQSSVVRVAYVTLIAAIFGLLWFDIGSLSQRQTLSNTAVVFWVLATIWVMTPGLARAQSYFNTLIKLFAGIGVLAPSWYALVSIHASPQMGPQWILYILFLIWIADSGAYFAGRAYGRHKLAPIVSPGKTWEGAAGAFVLVLLYSLSAPLWLPVAADKGFTLVWMSLLLVPVSIIGDLFESLMKRQSGIKDSGNILPGHGGIMDRFDSLTAVFPIAMWLALQVDYL